MVQADTKRKLTLEEKRKLEKIIFADIEKAECDYLNARSGERAEVKTKCIKNAPSQVKTLFKKYAEASKVRKQSEKALDKMGYSVSDYGNTPELKISHGDYPKELELFDTETNKKEDELSTMKRTYTIKLFAGGEEATELFKTLAQDLARLIK